MATPSPPEWLELARSEIGTKEWLGATNNPKIVQYFVDAVGKKFADEVPWCAAAVGSWLARCNVKPSGSLMARSYLKWGRKLPGPRVGCVVVFPRGQSWQGHVALVESFTDKTLTVIDGNKNNAVRRSTYPRAKALGYRWP